MEKPLTRLQPLLNVVAKHIVAFSFALFNAGAVIWVLGPKTPEKLEKLSGGHTAGDCIVFGFILVIVK